MRTSDRSCLQDHHLFLLGLLCLRIPGPLPLLTPAVAFEGPQGGKLLEGLPELGKALALTVKVYYRERMQIKIGSGKRHMGRAREGAKPKLPVGPSLCSQDIVLSWGQCMMVHLQR